MIDFEAAEWAPMAKVPFFFFLAEKVLAPQAFDHWRRVSQDLGDTDVDQGGKLQREL